MKAILKYSAALLALVAASSCNKIEDNKTENNGLVHFSVTAGTPATKVYLEDMGEGSYQPCWNAEDKLAVFFTLPDVPKSTDFSTVDAEFAATLSNGGMTATFEGDVDGDLLVDLVDSEGNLEMYSFLPKSTLVKAYAEGRIGLDVPNQQSPVYVNDNYSFDPKADILIAKPHTVSIVDDHASSQESMLFQRITSTLKINLLDPDKSAMNGEELESLTITTAKAHIAGRLTIDLKTSEVVSVGQRGGSTSIIASPAEGVNTKVGLNGSNSVFVSAAPVKIAADEELTFIVKTKNYTYTKTVTEHPEMELAAGKISTINLNIVASDVESNATPLATMDEIFTKASQVGGTATDVYITFNNWVVSGVKGTSNAYVTDGTKGFIIYANNHGFKAGDVLSGTIACKVQLYNGAAELTGVTSTTSGLTVTAGGTLTPYETTIDALSGINTGALVNLSELTYNGSVFTDGTNSITPYDTFNTGYSLTSGRKYEVEGIYIQFKTTKEVSPLTLDGFKLVVEKTYTVNVAETENGTVAVSATSAVAGQTVEITASPAEGYRVASISVTDKNNAEIAVNNFKFTMPASDVNVSVTFEQESSNAETAKFVYANLYSDITGSSSKNLDGASDEVDGVTIAYKKVSGSNAPMYYANGTNLRIYNESTITVTAPEGKKIKSIAAKGTTTWATGKMSADSGSVSDANKEWTGSAEKVILSITGSFRFTEIDVTFE